MMRASILLCFSLFTMAVSADAVYRAEASSESVRTGEVVEISFRVEGGNLSRFSAPDFSPFTIVSGPSRVQNFSMVNGRVSRSVIISYALRATRQGTFTLAGATGEINGKMRTFNPVSITVESGDNQDAPAETTEGAARGDLFLVVSADKQNVWEGEQIILTYKLYYRINFENVQIVQSPSYEGFLMHDFGIGQPQERVESYRGERYYSLMFRKVALFPAKSGSLRIPPIELECTVFEGGRGLFSTPRKNRVIVRSNTLNITVRPLPAEGRPADFSGVVGQFSLQGYLDRTRIAAGDGATVTAILRGIGNLKMAHINPPEAPNGLDIYGPTVQENFSAGSDALQGSKSFLFVVIPEKQGNYNIPPVSFSYFDPQSGRYETINTTALALEATKMVSERQEEASPGKFVPLWKQKLQHFFSIAGRILLLSLGILSALALLFFWFWYRRKKKRKQIVSTPVAPVTPATPTKDRKKSYLHELVLVEQAAKDHDTAAFYRRLPRVLWVALMPPENAYDRSRLLAAIREKNPTLAPLAEGLLQNAEWQLYGGGRKVNLEEDLDTLKNMLDQLL